MLNRLTSRELIDAVVKLSSARTIEAIAAVIRTSARTLTGADGVTFVLREGDSCHYADEDAIGPLWKGRRFPMDACISGWVMRNRQPVRIPDIYADSRIPQDAYRPTFVRSLLMAPIRREDPIGAIGAYWAEIGRPGDREMEIVQSLADASALAVANVELYAALQATIDSERAAREAAEEADRLKSEFLATLSHELRTPLHVMGGWIWRLRQPGLDRAVQQRGLEVVERNLALQSRLVDDLLDTSRAMWGTMQLEKRPVDLCAVCRAMAESAAPAAEARDVRLETVLPDRPAMIVGDSERLAQILGNLLSNAVKFSAPGGRVRLTVSPGPEGIRVEVADEGIGMDPAFLPHAFEAFRQADTGTTRRYGGLGLGLALVRHLTGLHGGTVHAASAGRGHGTTVTLEFPLPGAAGAEGLAAAG